MSHISMKKLSSVKGKNALNRIVLGALLCYAVLGDGWMVLGLSVHTPGTRPSSRSTQAESLEQSNLQTIRSRLPNNSKQINLPILKNNPVTVAHYLQSIKGSSILPETIKGIITSRFSKDDPKNNITNQKHGRVFGLTHEWRSGLILLGKSE